LRYSHRVGGAVVGLRVLALKQLENVGVDVALGLLLAGQPAPQRSPGSVFRLISLSSDIAFIKLDVGIVESPSSAHDAPSPVPARTCSPPARLLARDLVLLIGFGIGCGLLTDFPIRLISLAGFAPRPGSRCIVASNATVRTRAGESAF
jgi:hypothetical protein